MEAGSESRLRSTLGVFGTAPSATVPCSSSSSPGSPSRAAGATGVTPYEEAQALLGKTRCPAALDRAPEAAARLAAAREIFARLGAVPALAETEEWLSRTRRA